MKSTKGITFADIFGDSDTGLALWLLLAAFALDLFLLLRLRRSARVGSPTGVLITAGAPMIQGVVCAVLACLFAEYHRLGLVHSLWIIEGWEPILLRLLAAATFVILGMSWSMVLLGFVAIFCVGRETPK